MLSTATIACVIAAIVLMSCGGSGSSNIPNSQGPSGDPIALTVQDVQSIVNAAAVSVNVPIAIAVSDRLGNVLGVFDVSGSPATGPGDFYEEPNAQPVNANQLAVALARTAAFFSNNQAPLSSRTVRYISGIHFPPGVDNAPNAALYGIENTNRGCQLDSNLTVGVDVANDTLINSTSPGLGVLTGKGFIDDHDPTAVNPGGVPIFRNVPDPNNPGTNNNFLVGGVGVVADSNALGMNLAYEVAEYAAFSGANAPQANPAPSCSTVSPSVCNFAPIPVPLPPPGAVLINGVALPFVNQTTIPAGISPSNSFTGNYFPLNSCAGQPNSMNQTYQTCAGVLPIDGVNGEPGAYLLGPNAGSVLSQAEVSNIVNNAVATAKLTRAVIRLPLESRTRMSIAVSDTDGTLLALYRMTDGTIFSIDVAATKSRNAVYFSSTAPTVAQDLPGVPLGTAVTNRTIGFGAQPLFPPGINASSPGPFYNLYLNDVYLNYVNLNVNPCTQGSQPANTNQSGIVFFPGSLPLYMNGTLVGGLGVSGDGVDQDDYVTYGGAAGFYAPTAIQADQVVIDNVRLPYLNFPRNPTD